MSSLKFWLWLCTKQTLNNERKAALLDGLGDPETVFYSDREELAERFSLSERQLAELGDKSFDRAERVYDLCQARNIKLLCMQDAVYPERLRALRDPPPVLYYRGKLPVMDEEAAIGVVGTRKPTMYGETVAMRLGFQLAKGGALVVSGMAEGIDGIAQRGALRAGCPTVAVLGTSPDIAYPAINRELYEDIIVMGAVVSEYPPGLPAEKNSFPRRNRLISGLSLGIVVVEAPPGSGSLITANHALEQDRDIFAVPGSVDVQESYGCHKLIREGAVLATCGEDILDEYRALYAHKLTAVTPEAENAQDYSVRQRKKAKHPARPAAKPEPPSLPQVTDLSERFSSYKPEQQMILYAVAAEARSTDDIVRLTGLHPELLLSELSLLELEGVLRKTPGGRFIAAED